MKVEALYRYPVKSLQGEAVTSAEVAERGFVDDRRWMLVDNYGRFISQREYHHLARFAARTDKGEGLLLYALHAPDASFSIPAARPAGDPGFQVTVWDDTFLACEVPAPGLGAFVGIPGARLVYMNDAVTRPVDERYAERDETVSFADGYPYLVTTTASLRMLSDRTDQDVDVLRFRPNIVVATDDPFEEDAWQSIAVGAQEFYLPKPCARCIMVTLAPGSGEKDLAVLSELARFRRHRNKTLFGMNAIARQPGRRIAVGDDVTVLLRRNAEAVLQSQ